MSLLTICQNVGYEVGFDIPSIIAASTDQVALQLKRLCNREGKTLAQQSPPWQKLVKEGSITLATADQDYVLPSDFEYIIPDTTWNRSTDREVINPISSADWQYFKAWSSVAGLNLRARIRNGQIEFEQTITSAMNGQTIYYEYVHKYWCSSDGTTADQSAFAADTDVSLIDEEILTQGVVWRFKRQKGLDWETDFQDYSLLLRKKLAREAGSRTLDMTGDFGRSVGVNVPENGYGA